MSLISMNFKGEALRHISLSGWTFQKNLISVESIKALIKFTTKCYKITYNK